LSFCAFFSFCAFLSFFLAMTNLLDSVVD
jgi:hypothetical protein